MMKKYIIYVGVLFMPNKNAAAQRAVAISKMVESIDYQPVVIGMNPNLSEDNILDTELEYEGIKVFEMKYPNTSKEWMKMLFGYGDIAKVLKYLGYENCQALIAMDYFSPALHSLFGVCKKHGIRLVLDTVDWFEKSAYAFPKGLIKDVDTLLRMHWLNKKADYLITISSYLEKFYKNSVNNIVRIPGVYYSGNSSSKEEYATNNVRTISFVGSPGKKCEKEKIDWVIQAVCKMNMSGGIKIKFVIAGIDKETLNINRPDLTHIDNFDDSIKCLGRISHYECKKLIASSDFTVIIRENTRLSNAGFPTKLGESYAYGTPVIVTPTSDICSYIPDGYGVISQKCTYDDVEKMIASIVNMTEEQIVDMHKKVTRDNPLDCSKFQYELRRIVQ